MRTECNYCLTLSAGLDRRRRCLQGDMVIIPVKSGDSGIGVTRWQGSTGIGKGIKITNLLTLPNEKTNLLRTPMMESTLLFLLHASTKKRSSLIDMRDGMTRLLPAIIQTSPGG